MSGRAGLHGQKLVDWEQGQDIFRVITKNIPLNVELSCSGLSLLLSTGGQRALDDVFPINA